ncbi:MAG: HAD family hydrolase [Clostridia bacterium]|nr:HAD family hydrolase [Clostridia bacterium]
MDIKLIVSDIDRTILPANQIISPATYNAVRDCRARGVEFVIASGRWYPAARKVAVDQLGIEDGYMIICNGGAVVRSDGSFLRQWRLSSAQAHQIYELLRAEQVMMTAYVPDAIYRVRSQYLTVFRLPETSYFDGGASYCVVDDDWQGFEERGLDGPYKIEAYADDTALLAHLRREVEAMGFQANSAFPFNLEIMAPGAGKGAAVRWLTAHMGLNRDQVMGFGDYTNDLPMLENVGWPVAVDNAIDEVKRACRIIAPSCEDDGVAQTIRKYVLGDEQL